MKITKLNSDSSWLWEFNGIKVMVDPWFTESQVDFHPWFSTQFHVHPQPKIQSLVKPDYLFISHRFTDHCNKETLIQFASTIPIVCSSAIIPIIEKWHHFQTILSLEEAPFHIEKISKSSFLDFVHDAFLICSEDKKLIYAPHGAKNVIKNPAADVLITTISTYKLPFFLGGTVNLGLKNAVELAKKLQVKKILSTHDEQKKQRGIVAKLSSRSMEHAPEVLVLSAGESFLV